MDQFLKVGDENPKETRPQKRNKRIVPDKGRVARLKRTFLPYWARESELASKTVSNVDAGR